MIKAVAGGEGAHARCPQRRLLSPSLSCRAHGSRQGFRNGDVYIEKLIVNPHHIEFRLWRTKHGHVVHLGERDCSIQRRQPKSDRGMSFAAHDRGVAQEKWDTPP